MSASPKPIRAARSDYLLRSISPHPPPSSPHPPQDVRVPQGRAGTRDNGACRTWEGGGQEDKARGSGSKGPYGTQTGASSLALSRQPLISARLLALPKGKERPAWARRVRGLLLGQCCTCLGPPGPAVLCRGLPWPQEAASTQPGSPAGETEEAGKDLNPVLLPLTLTSIQIRDFFKLGLPISPTSLCRLIQASRSRAPSSVKAGLGSKGLGHLRQSPPGLETRAHLGRSPRRPAGHQLPLLPPSTLLGHTCSGTHAHIYYTGHTHKCHTHRYTHTPPCTHTRHRKHKHIWHVLQPGAGNSAQTTDSHSPLALMTQHLLKGASALLGSGEAPRRGRGQGLGGACGWACGRGLQGPGPSGAASSSLPGRSSECRHQTAGRWADRARNLLARSHRGSGLPAPLCTIRGREGRGKAGRVGRKAWLQRICTRCLSWEPGPAQTLVNPVSPWRLSGRIPV